jgi:hypothetical protein
VITNLLKIHDIRQIVRAELDIPGSEPAVTIDHLGCKAVSGRQLGWSPTAIRNQIQCVEAMEGRIRRWAGNGNEKIGTNFGWNDENIWCICNRRITSFYGFLDTIVRHPKHASTD